jgi:hypothetical protein
MKKLIVIAAIALFSCQKQASTNLRPQSLPGDPELVNHIKDAEAVAYRKNNPHGNPHVIDTTTQQPPPVTIHKACFLLDFDGYNVPAGVWGALPISCSGSDFTSSEIADIITRVKSYWKFDVEITTDEALYNTYSKKMRCIVTRTNFYGNYGGVAYIGSLNWIDQEKECFVFCDLLQRNTKYNADAIAHELGHTANCYHHVELRNDVNGSCYVYSDYLWANHIMGASYYDPNPVFNTGFMYCGATTDDINNITNSLNQ